MHWVSGFPYFFLIFGGLIKLLVFVGLVVLLVLAIRALNRNSAAHKVQPVISTTTNIDPALEILRERFARGEIDKEQYEALRRDLGA